MINYTVKLNKGFNSVIKYKNGEEYCGLIRHKNIYHVIEVLKKELGFNNFETLDIKFKSYRATFYKKIGNLELSDYTDDKEMLFLELFNLRATKNNIFTDGYKIYTLTTAPSFNKIVRKYNFDRKRVLYECFPDCENYAYNLRTKVQDIINSVNNDYIYLEGIFYENLLKIIS